MSLTIEAVYENGVLRPDQPLPLKEHERVKVTIQAAGSVATQVEPSGVTPQLREWAQVQFTDEEVLTGLREVRETGGLGFDDFLEDLTRAATQ
jgi:predicted DNA-binding antitoxin AbrB/MazE fold protein